MYLVANSYAGIAAETTRGTSVAAATFLPISSPQVTPDQKWLRDEGMRGSPGTLYGDQEGVRNDKYSHKGYAFPSQIQNLFRAILGSTDTVASVGSLHSHTIGLFNSASVGSQPPSYSLTDFDGQFAYILTGSQANKLVLDWKADGALEYTMDWVCNPFASVAPPTESYDGTLFVPGWNLAASIGAASITAIVDATVTIDRKTAAVFAGGGQPPFQNFAGPCDVSGKGTAVVASTVFDYMTNSLADNPEVLNLIWSLPGTTQPSVQLRMSQTQFKTPQKKRDKTYLEIDFTFDAELNTTDAVSGGYSPIWTQTINGVTTAA